jgi:caffeoyl-CoA O-methyltransferase
MDGLARYMEEHSAAGTAAERALLDELERATNLRVVQPKMVSGRHQGAFLRLITEIVRPRRVLEIGTFTGYSALSIAAGLGEGAEIHTVEVDDELEDLARSFFDRSPHGAKIRLHIGSALEVVPALFSELSGGLSERLSAGVSGGFLRGESGFEGGFEGFDMVFIDGDKREYPDYYRMLMGGVSAGERGVAGAAIEGLSAVGEGGTSADWSGGVRMVRSGGIILTDHVLWYGKVVEGAGGFAGGAGVGAGDGLSGGAGSGRAAAGEVAAAAAASAAREVAAAAEADRRGVKMDAHTAGIVEFNRMVAADPRVENVIIPLRDGINLIRVK